MVTAFLLKYWKQLIVLLSVVIALSLLYNHTYNKGYDAASKAYEQEIAKYKKEVSDKIAAIERTSTLLLEQSIVEQQKDAEDFEKLLATIKNKKMYVINNNICEPSPDLVKIYNDSVDRANKR